MTIAISNDFLAAFSNVQKGQQKQVREFVEKFREHPDAPGLNYERIEAVKGQHLFSVRVNQGYRVVVHHTPGSDEYLLLWVDSHDEAYRWATKRKLQVHPATGALQIVNIETADAAPPVPATKAAKDPPAGLFKDIKDKHLLRFGVPEDLLPAARAITSDADLESKAAIFPQEAFEALFMLAAGYSVDEVLDETNKKGEAPAVDTADMASALENEDSKRRFYVIDEAKDLLELLNAPLEQWRVFLHPAQRRLVQMNANGPVRVLGGAGTGKTVAAMHRARYLVEDVFTGKNDRILFTTFTKNLATDIQENLRKICSADQLSRIEVANLDAWVSNFVRGQGFKTQALFGDDGKEAWESALAVAPTGLGLSLEFYRSEWEQVVQAHNILDATQYLRVARIGRGTKLSREAKQKVWPVFQEYRAQLNEIGKKEYVDLIRDARDLIESKKIKLPYRSVVVDEAQDMSAEAFKLVRAIVPEGQNDLFIVGDAHQRIYRHRVTLGQCGINIRGRGKRLKINYRTTEEIRRFSVALLEGRPIDDLDGGQDEQKGYVSLTHGRAPEIKAFKTIEDEVAFLKKHLDALVKQGVPLESVCLVTRTKQKVYAYMKRLNEQGFTTYEIKRIAPDLRDKPGLRVATMHRVKGLEFEHIIVAGANKGTIPLTTVIEDAEDAVAARNAETGERSLLYVAITRAKRSALVTAHGEISPFLKKSI